MTSQLSLVTLALTGTSPFLKSACRLLFSSSSVVVRLECTMSCTDSGNDLFFDIAINNCANENVDGSQLSRIL